MLIHSEMENVLKKLKDNSIDAVITDPPYGVRAEEWDDKDNFLANIDLWLNECIRVSKGTVIWFCASRMIPFIFKNNGHNFYRLHVWDKPEGTQFAGASNNNIWYSIEPILIFTKDLQKTKSYGKDMPFSYDTFQYRTIPHKEYDHPTSKPVSLMRKLIGHYTNVGETILDPFAGSFSTAIASIDMSRRCIAIEKDDIHYKNGVERVKKHLSQPRMFVGVADIDTENQPIQEEMFNETDN